MVTNQVLALIPATLETELADLVEGRSQLSLTELRQSAKSFKPTQLKKELKVHRLIQP
jgi:hypothetical protein